MDMGYPALIPEPDPKDKEAESEHDSSGSKKPLGSSFPKNWEPTTNGIPSPLRKPKA